MNAGNLLWQRAEHEKAYPHYRKAMSLASNQHSTFLSEVAVSRYLSLHNNHERRHMEEGLQLSRQALEHAQTEQEKCAARLLIGLFAADLKQHDLAYENLRDEPWKKVSAMDDFYLRHDVFSDRAKRFLGNYLVDRGIDVARGKVLLSSIQGSYLELPRPVTRMRLVDETSTWDPMAARWSTQFRDKAIPVEDRQLAEALIVRYEVQNAQTDEELADATESAADVAKRLSGDRRASGVARTIAGIGFYELGRYDEAWAQLKDKPWEDIGEGNIGQDWIMTARACALNMQLMNGGDPDALIPQFLAVRGAGGPYVRTAPRAEWFLVAAYAMSRSPGAKDQLREQLKPLITEVARSYPINALLYPEEQQFIKEKLAKANVPVVMK
jgi:hypothetical protein